MPPYSLDKSNSDLPDAVAEALRDRYEIVRETGSGASSTVYIARDLKHQRLVALKMLNPDVGPTMGARFLREIQVAAGMQHPHILPMYDSGVIGGRLYFVMPFVDGGSLRQRLDATPQLAVHEALRCAREIALALAFAHEQGVIHRDVKPENILFYHGEACLADFGVARVIEQIDPAVTGHGIVVGTPLYMSPEQMSHAGFDGRSDVYSLATVLYEMIAGVRAFSGSTPEELLRQRLRTPPPSVRTQRPDVPESVDVLLARALAAKPDQRFADATAFARAIENALHDRSTPARRVSAARAALAAPPRRRLLWTVGAAAVLVASTLAWKPLSHVWPRETIRPGDSLGAGRAALTAWDLENAERQLAAAAGDTQSVAARLWLAETFALERRASTGAFRVVATRLASSRPALHGRDSLLAEGLIALAERDYPRACDVYGGLRARDSLDVLAWYGLGDCESLDRTVVRDPRSASGWRFRTSWPAAARAYMRAVTIEPRSHRAVPYTLLTTLLPIDPTFIRAGQSDATPSLSFAAYPSLVGDTVTYVPYSIADIGADKARTISASLPEVLRRNRDTLLGFAREWVAAAPRSADAFEALALAHEARTEIGDDDAAAGGALRRARALSTSTEQQVRLAAFAVRLDVKRGAFDAARTHAEQALETWGADTANRPVAMRLAGLAALTGRVELAGRYLASWSAAPNADAGIAPPLTAAASRLFTRAAAGVCDDSLVVLSRAVEDLLDSYSEPSARGGMRRDLLGRSMALAFPCLGARAFAALPVVTPLDRAQRATAAGDRRRAHAILDSLADVRRGYRPGDVSLDYTVQEASLYATLGDTAAALHRLDLVLDALPTLGSLSVREEAQAAAVGRALMLDAELAAHRGDGAKAKARAAAAAALWRHADPSLAPAVTRLQALAASGR